MQPRGPKFTILSGHVGEILLFNKFFRLTNISQSLPHKMAENSWHRYDRKKLRHCHPMYIQVLIFNSRNLQPSNQKSMVLAVHAYGSPSTRRHAASCMGSRALVSDGERAARCRRPSGYIGLSTHVDTNNTPAGRQYIRPTTQRSACYHPYTTGPVH